MPSIPGSHTSSKTQLNGRRSKYSRHSSPEAAVSTDMPSSSSTPASERRIPSSSSTIRTELGISEHRERRILSYGRDLRHSLQCLHYLSRLGGRARTKG